MKSFIGCLMAFGMISVQAATQQAYVCQAECLGVNVSERSVEFLGNFQAVALTRSEAWKKLSKRCEKEASRFYSQPVLTEEAVFIRVNQSNHYSSSSSVQYDSISTYYYSEVLTTASGESSYQQAGQMTLRVTPAKAKTSCNLEEVNEEELQDYYDGDLPIFG